MVPAILFFTVVTAVGLGIVTAYGAVTSILYALADHSTERATRTPLLVPTETHASGD